MNKYLSIQLCIMTIVCLDVVLGEILIGPNESKECNQWKKAFNQPNSRVFMWHMFKSEQKMDL